MFTAKATEPGEEIKYIDVTSLYPWVNKNCTYPVRHPQIYTNPQDQNITHWFGLAKGDILIPEFLFHPVLPVRSGGKFPLCAARVREEPAKANMLHRSNMCHHKDQERLLRGT